MTGKDTRRRMAGIWGAALAAVVWITPPAQALIIINEILADPAADLAGDANADGVASVTQKKKAACPFACRGQQAELTKVTL